MFDQRIRSFGSAFRAAIAVPAKRNAVRRMAAGLIVVSIASFTSLARASAETRSLDIQHIHTNEHEVIVFKRDGVYDQQGLARLNHILRDWRRNEEVRMDPALFDLLWQVYRETGATGPIEIVCGYRAPETNNMLRSRTRGVAKFSQHTLGKAIDFFMPGVSLERLREAGMKLQVGGVGFYPTSGSPFVHMDTGSVRAWPRMSREQLVRLFPDGKTLHLPAEGDPLPGYQQALAEYQARHSGQATQVADTSASRGRGNLLAALFGMKSGEDEDETTPQKAAPAPLPTRSAQRSVTTPLPAPQVPATETPATRTPDRPLLLASLPMPPARNPLLEAEGNTPAARLTPVSLTMANVPPPPAAAPRAPGAIWRNGNSAEAVAAVKGTAMPLPALRPSAIIASAARQREETAGQTSTGSRAMDDAFSALTGAPRDDTSQPALGYAPLNDARYADRTPQSQRDPAGRLKLASLGNTDIAPSLSSRPAKQARAPVEAAKSNRADQMARLVSYVGEKIDTRLLDAASSTRAPAVARLTHPDQSTVTQMIVKPREILAEAGFMAVAAPLPANRFSGPAVVALAIIETH